MLGYVVVVNSPGWPTVKHAFFDGAALQGQLPGDRATRSCVNIKIFLIAEVIILRSALLLAVHAEPARAGLLPDPRDGDPLHRLLPGRPDDSASSACSASASRRSSSRALPTSRRSSGASWRSSCVYSAYVAEVYRAGIDSVHPSQNAAARSLGLTALAVAAVRRRAAGGPPGRSAAPERLHRAAEGHGAPRASIGVTEAFRQAQIDVAATFNFTPYVAPRSVFVLFTIPLARFVDWLMARERARRQAGGLA